MLRALIVIHRYAGVVLGVLMTLWCLSGFVMMYQSYPALEPKERLAALQPLSLAGCCNVPVAGLADDMEVSDFRIEMLGGRPVLNLSSAEGRFPQLIDLTTGQPKTAISRFEATTTAARFGKSRGIDAPPAYLGEVAIDQWTIQTARRHQPVRHFRFPDSRATEVYVSGVTGEIIQDTTRRERVLSWLGAIPHWLYPTVLRQDGELWSKIVIYSSLIGVFLTVTGLYVGIMRLRRLPSGRWSPFKGWWFWHHMIGLVFGILTLTWVFSGLLTMSPWGIFEAAPNTLRKEVVGTITGGDVKRIIAVAPKIEDGHTVQLSAAILGATPYFLTTGAAGEIARHDVGGNVSPLQESEVRLVLAGQPTGSFELLEKEDAYYYGHHGEVTLPVYRAVLADQGKTRIYIDAASGKILRIVDANRKKARWLETALHDFDWPGLRKRPIWDLVVVPLLLGVTALCITGTWLSFMRVGRDAGAVRVAFRRRRLRPARRKG